MITTYIPNHFIPERSYIVSVMLRHYLGIEVEIVPRPGQLQYELSWGDRSIIIRDQFFGHTIVGESYLSEDRIPEKITEAKTPGLDQVLIVYGKDQVEIAAEKIVCDVDLFAGAFFMLTRWEEAVGQHEDLHGRFPAARALVVRSGVILRPVVDEYVTLLRKWLLQLGYAVPQDKREYTVVPTCDVDMPYYWLRTPQWKVIFGEWMKNKSFQTIRETRRKMRLVQEHQLQDPYDTFSYMMDTAEKAGLRFEFNMLVGGISKFEGYYSIRDARIKALVHSFLKRGHRIGLHPSYNSFMDHRLLGEEKKLLEHQLDATITSSRQHYLKFAVPKTWRILAEAGIRTDSTMGYAAEPGFRCGTSKSFPVFDIHQCIQLPLTERPLLIMDVSFRFYKKYTPDESIALCDAIIAQVKKHRGELVFLWHNSNLSEMENWGEWREVMEWLIFGGSKSET